MREYDDGDKDDDGDEEPSSLFKVRVNTWTGRTRGDRPPYVFEHWTRHGTFRTEAVYPGGLLMCELVLDTRRIGTFVNPGHAASSLSSGSLDKELGFSAREAGVPDRLSRWGRS